jgi:hypothetical protein
LRGAGEQSRSKLASSISIADPLWAFRCGELNNSRCPFVVETE